MHAIVVYESVWGNTAAIARAIAEGLGPETRAFATDEVPTDAIASADLIVAGAPVFAFGLPTEGMRQNVARGEMDPAHMPDLAHPSLRSWLDRLPAGRGRSAAFETRIWWTPRGATGTIEKKLAKAGYPALQKAGRFVVRDKYGPLEDGEVERAREWGTELRRTLEGEAARAQGH